MLVGVGARGRQASGLVRADARRKRTHVAIDVERDGETLFAMTDRHPYRHGHFGVRTTQSHIQLRNFAIIRL